MNTSTKQIPVVDTATDTVRVVQLTDTHLCEQLGGELLGMDTDHSLQAVLDTVKVEQPQIDLLLGTGDLSDRGALTAYQRVESYFSQLKDRFFWLPGNHDDRQQMFEAAATTERLSDEVEAGNWQIILLDSQIPGAVGGELGPAELARLEAALKRGQAKGQFALICLHHQPVAIGCEWLDEQMVADADAFWAVLERYPNVRGVLWGHVHQQFEQQRGDIQLLASPSTCVQFRPGSVDFCADAQAPGYRWLELGANGAIKSGISRVSGVKFKVDLECGGYLD